MDIQQTYISEKVRNSSNVVINPATEEKQDLIITELMKDHTIEMALGNIVGHSVKTIYGRNPDVDTGVTESVWNGGLLYTGHNATGAEIVSIVSSSANDTSAGTGARTIKLYGLSGAGVEQTETITLNGTTPVTSSLSYLRMEKAITITAGSGGSNAGAITCNQSVTTANVFFSMPIGVNHTAVGAYTVPAGKKGLLKCMDASVVTPNTANCKFTMLVRQPGEVWQVEHLGSAVSAAPLIKDWVYFKDEILNPLADIRIDVATDANNTEVTASFCLILVDL